MIDRFIGFLCRFVIQMDEGCLSATIAPKNETSECTRARLLLLLTTRARILMRNQARHKRSGEADKNLHFFPSPDYKGRTTRVLGPLRLKGEPATGVMELGVMVKTYSLLVARLVA